MLPRNRGIIILCIVSLLIRLGIMWYATGYRDNTDILRWKDWGRIAVTHGFAATYDRADLLTFGTYPNNMPPGTLYVVTSMYWVWLQSGKVFALFGVAPGSNQWVNSALLTILLRIPSLLADISIGVLLYTMIRQFGRKHRESMFGASLFLFNPVVLFNSAFWGQMDSVNNFLFIASIWLLLRGNRVGAALAFTGSLLVKLSLIFALPIVAAYGFAAKRAQILRPMIAVLLFLVLAVLPISRQPVRWMTEYMRHNATGEMQNVTASAFNAWWVVFAPRITFGPGPDLFTLSDTKLVGAPLVQTRVAGTTLGTLTLIIYAIIISPLYWRIWQHIRSDRKEQSGKMLILALSAVAIVSFLFLPQMHNRYLYPVFAPLALAVGLGMPFIAEFGALSVLHFINMLVVWHPAPMPMWAYPVMRSSVFQWSVAVITTLIGLWTYAKLIQSMRLRKKDRKI